MKPRTWYHITQTHSAPALRVRRRAPALRATGEPLTPRLCVAPTVAACFAARLFDAGSVNVYAARCRAVKPRGVWDHYITDEHWLIPPMELTLQRVVSAAEAKAVQEFSVLYIQLTKRSPTWRLRLAQYAIAHSILGGPRWEQRWLTGAVQRHLHMSAEDYIFSCAQSHLSI